MIKQSSSHFDAIVLGVGSMGAAACWYLAKRGQKVLGLEQFDIPHDKGSHAGQSRIIRKAYFEHPDYVPLLQRAYDNWRSFEAETGSTFYHRTGILYFGRSDNENITGVRNSAKLHNIAIENWNPSQCKKLHPAFEVPKDFEVIYEPDAGFVTPEHAVKRYGHEAEKLGAAIKKNTPVLEWKQDAGKIRVITAETDYTADKLIIAAGAWASRMIPKLNINLKVTRQLLAWVLPPDPGAFAEGNFPCWFVEDPGVGTFYGFPLLPAGPGPVGLKLAHHHPGVPSGPDEIDGPVPREEEEKLTLFLRRYIPAAGENIVFTKHCLYTSSPDNHFIIDHLPGYDKKVAIACGFSGHGFKFVPVVGEVLADLVMKGKTDLPIGFLGMRRF